jgi:enoyl-CoA hydratase/carnithine racemase
MGELVTYSVHDSVATITMDDGKVNALSPAMLGELDSAFDEAQRDGAVIVLAGRDGIFSAGFDLKVLRGGGADAVPMLQEGFKLAERLLSCPVPVVVACSGHAIAMGAFLVLAGDYRIGVTGAFRITANEVAIGLTMPRAAVEICRQRLAPAQFNRAVILADVFSPEEAVVAGFLDLVVAPSDLGSSVSSVAQRLAALDLPAHHATKLRARARSLQRLRAAMEQDEAELTG